MTTAETFKQNSDAMLTVKESDAWRILCFMNAYMSHDERFQKALAEQIAQYSVNPVCQVTKN